MRARQLYHNLLQIFQGLAGEISDAIVRGALWIFAKNDFHFPAILEPGEISSKWQKFCKEMNSFFTFSTTSAMRSARNQLKRIQSLFYRSEPIFLYLKTRVLNTSKIPQPSNCIKLKAVKSGRCWHSILTLANLTPPP